MIYQILNEKDEVKNTIIAEPDFVEKNYKGLYRDVTPKPVAIVEAIPVKTLEEKVDQLLLDMQEIKTTLVIK